MNALIIVLSHEVVAYTSLKAMVRYTQEATVNRGSNNSLGGEKIRYSKYIKMISNTTKAV